MAQQSARQPLTPTLQKQIMDFNYNNAVFYKQNPNYFQQPKHVSPSKCYLGAYYDRKNSNVVSYTVADAQEALGKMTKLSGEKMFSREMTSEAVQKTVHLRMQQALSNTISSRGAIDGVRKEISIQQASYFSKFKPRSIKQQTKDIHFRQISDKMMNSLQKRYGKRIKTLVEYDMPKKSNENWPDYSAKVKNKTTDYLISGYCNKGKSTNSFWKIMNGLVTDIQARREDSSLAPIASKDSSAINLKDNPNWQKHDNDLIKRMIKSRIPKKDYQTDEEYQQEINASGDKTIKAINQSANKWLSSLGNKLSPKRKNDALYRGYQMTLNKLTDRLEDFEHPSRKQEYEQAEHKQEITVSNGYAHKDKLKPKDVQMTADELEKDENLDDDDLAF